MKTKIVLALVGNGTGVISSGFLMSTLRAFLNRDIELLYVSDGPYVGRARDAAATYFLEKTKTPWLLFIDMDMVYTPQDISRLFESNDPIVGGVYYIKDQNKRQIAAIQLPDKEYDDNFQGRVEVARAGTGFMRIHRSVFANLVTVEKYKHEGKLLYNFFPMPITDGELLSEDWGFCDLAREAGFKIMLDTRIRVLHQGTALYPLQPKV